ncbi:transposase family protein [Cyanobacteria bacterium FACHB-63]|nr:transposase family protein [Cyanobacteria bacterium FACHB-63]
MERTKRHKLINILTIAILAVICGADSWVRMESFGQAKQSWLSRILDLPNGIPSHDTFARVFAPLNSEQF